MTIPNHSSTPTASPAGLPSPTHTPRPSPTPSAAFAEAKTVFSFLTAWDDLPAGEAVVYWDPIATSPTTWRFRYYAWSGESGDLLETSEWGYELVPSQLSSGRIAVSEGEGQPGARIDVIDLDTQLVRTYETACRQGEELRRERLGPEHLVVECWEPGRGLQHFRFIPLGDPTGAFDLPRPSDALGDFSAPTLTWLDPSRVYLRDFWGHAACLLSVEDSPGDWLLPAGCMAADYYFGEISPDGRWIEIRDGDNLMPDRIAALPLTCLQDPAGSACEPKWVDVGLDYGDWRGLRAGAWSPDSRHLYLVNWAPPLMEPGRPPFEVLRFDRENSVLGVVGTIPNRPPSDAPWTDVLLGGGPVWSPGWMEIMVSQGGCYACEPPREKLQAFCTETGELRTLVDDGGPVVGVIRKD